MTKFFYKTMTQKVTKIKKEDEKEERDEDMEQIIEQKAQEQIKLGKEEIKKIINEGGKITDTIITEKGKITQIRRIEPVNDEATSSTIIQTNNEINIKCL